MKYESFAEVETALTLEGYRRVEPAPTATKPPLRITLETEPRDDSWYERAACRGSHPDLFFGPESERKRKGGDTLHRHDEALAVCRACPVSDECLARALADNERWGVWGGTTPRDRWRIRRHSETAKPMRVCSVGGCGRPHEQHGLCGMHRARKARTGSTELPVVWGDWRGKGVASPPPPRGDREAQARWAAAEALS